MSMEGNQEASGKMPHPPAKRAPGCRVEGGWGALPGLRCSLPRWLWSLIPPRAGMQPLCWSFLTIVRTSSTPQSSRRKRCLTGVLYHGAPYHLQRSLKGLILSECRALSLLFYPIRCVFFCPRQAQGFNFWDIEFHLLLSPPSPGYWSGVVVLWFPTPPRPPQFLSWSWWIWICESLVSASIIF